MLRASVFEWFKRGQDSCKNESRSGHPLKSRNDKMIDKVRKLARKDKYMKNIITGDESSVYSHDPETKKQPSMWNTPTSLHRRRHESSE